MFSQNAVRLATRVGAHVVHRSFRILAFIFDASPLSFQAMLATGVSKLWIILVNGWEEATAVYKGNIDCFVGSITVVVEITQTTPNSSIVLYSGGCGELDADPKNVSEIRLEYHPRTLPEDIDSRCPHVIV
jgi:hypothetical protein